MKFFMFLVNLFLLVQLSSTTASNAGETKMLAKLEKLNTMIEEYKQSSTADDPLLATKIADLNNIASNLKTQIRSKRKAKEVAKKTQDEEENKKKEKLKQEEEAAKVAEKKRKEKLQQQREAEASRKKKVHESKPKSFTTGNVLPVLPWIQNMMKQHVNPFVSKIPVPQFIHDLEAFCGDNIFFRLPLQHRPYAFWASLMLLAFFSLVALIVVLTSGRRTRQKKNTLDLMHDNFTMMTPAEIQRLQMEKQALESRLRMITAMRSTNNNNNNNNNIDNESSPSSNSSADEKQKVLDEAARQVAQSKLVEYATEAAAARSSLALVQQQLNAAILQAKELSDKVTGEGDPQYINELKKHVLELNQKQMEDEDTLILVRQELKATKEEAQMWQEQFYQLKQSKNGNETDHNESVLKDQLLALAKEFNSYKISSQKIIAELHLRISSSKSSSSNSNSINMEQITSQQLQQQQRGRNLDTFSYISELASESHDSNATPKRSRFVLPPSDPFSKG